MSQRLLDLDDNKPPHEDAPADVVAIAPSSPVTN